METSPVLEVQIEYRELTSHDLFQRATSMLCFERLLRTTDDRRLTTDDDRQLSDD